MDYYRLFSAIYNYWHKLSKIFCLIQSTLWAVNQNCKYNDHFCSSTTQHHDLETLYVGEKSSPDCNCTDYTLSKHSVGIGDTISLSLKINMRNKRQGRFMLNTIVGLNTKQRLYHILVVGNVI